jgi:hypothetical protein
MRGDRSANADCLRKVNKGGAAEKTSPMAIMDAGFRWAGASRIRDEIGIGRAMPCLAKPRGGR